MKLQFINFFLLLGLINSCKTRHEPGGPLIGNLENSHISSNADNIDGDKKPKDSQLELEQIKREKLSIQNQINSLKTKIDESSNKKSSNNQMTDDQKKALEDQIIQNQKLKDELDAQLLALNQKQSALEKKLGAPTKPSDTATNDKGGSGNPLCGAIYYGTEFDCKDKKCAKSDDKYLNICEITANSKPFNKAEPNPPAPAGYPACPETRYGVEFDCNGKRCAKSDAEYKNICEIK